MVPFSVQQVDMFVPARTQTYTASLENPSHFIADQWNLESERVDMHSELFNLK